MSKITRRNFLKVSGVAAAAAALTACGGSSSTASSAASGAASSEAASTAAKLDKIKVAVPNDTTNEARALTLLEKNGFFKLKADAGLTATKNDIEENPLNVNVDEVEAAQVPNVQLRHLCRSGPHDRRSGHGGRHLCLRQRSGLQGRQ